MKFIPYNSERAVNYALKWALKRNKKYYDFSNIGGDCTNYVSQCVFAGAGVMNYNLYSGWFYTSASLRAPSWTGVSEFYNFAVNNKSYGFYAKEVALKDIQIGDVIQLGNDIGFYHNLFVSKIDDGNVYVCSHSIDRLNAPLSGFNYKKIRPLHVLGARDV